MATTHPLPAQAIDQIPTVKSGDLMQRSPAETPDEEALVPSPRKFEPAVITFDASCCTTSD